ncbi:MAG: branched-chain amino acid ABC transporter permease [Armatimonadetes bacterium]|nr:branched-chain amino acid ABC transporter permease [Armatimonadota bacterium]
MKFWAVRLLSVAVAFAVCIGFDNFAQATIPNFYRLVVLAGLYVTLAVSLNLINGITGQFSIGHGAFYMVGAYATGYFSKHAFHGQAPPFVWMSLMAVFGAFFAAVAGLIVGLPSLRLRGDYLAIVTLGFGEIIRIITQNVEEIGGSYGMNVRPFGSPPHALSLVLLLAVLCVAVCRNLLKTSHGLPFIAVREDEVASSAMGVKTATVKVTSFIIGSAFAGAAGALLAHSETFISPDTFKMDVSFIILTMVVLGGTGSITGSVISAVALFGIPEYLRYLQSMVGGGSIMGAIFAIGLVVSGLRYVQQNCHVGLGKKLGFYGLCVLGGFVVQFALTPLFNLVPALAALRMEVSGLRMVIFSAVLIILMLLRPQGIFAHHEFGWNALARLLRGKKGAAA